LSILLQRNNFETCFTFISEQLFIKSLSKVNFPKAHYSLKKVKKKKKTIGTLNYSQLDRIIYWCTQFVQTISDPPWKKHSLDQNAFYPLLNYISLSLWVYLLDLSPLNCNIGLDFSWFCLLITCQAYLCTDEIKNMQEGNSDLIKYCYFSEINKIFKCHCSSYLQFIILVTPVMRHFLSIFCSPQK
jgi:hypothetical protein